MPSKNQDLNIPSPQYTRDLDHVFTTDTLDMQEDELPVVPPDPAMGEQQKIQGDLSTD